jgi:uncharacterized protein YoxC
MRLLYYHVYLLLCYNVFMNETLIKADIFFFVTTVAVVIITIGLVVGMIYLIRILHVIKRISHRAEKTADMVADDIVELRNTIKEQGMSAKRILNFFKNKSKKR